MSKAIKILVFGLIVIFLGALIGGCENPFDDDDSAQVNGSSTIVGNIKTFETSDGLIYARALDESVLISLGSTGKTAATDANGNFIIEGVPAGTHELYMTCNGQTRAYTITVEENSKVVLSNVEVMADGTVIIGAISVIPNSTSTKSDDDDDDDEEVATVVVTPVNLSTNIDQSQALNSTGSNLGGASLHQTFTPAVDGDLVSVEIAVSSGIAAEFTVSILATTAGGYPTGGSLGSDTILVGDMEWSPNLTLFSFDPQITLEAGVQYAIKLSAISVDPGSVPQWRGAGGNPYAGGQEFIGGAPQADYDMVFGTYMAVVQ